MNAKTRQHFWAPKVDLMLVVPFKHLDFETEWRNWNGQPTTEKCRHTATSHWSMLTSIQICCLNCHCAHERNPLRKCATDMLAWWIVHSDCLMTVRLHNVGVWCGNCACLQRISLPISTPGTDCYREREILLSSGITQINAQQSCICANANGKPLHMCTNDHMQTFQPLVHGTAMFHKCAFETGGVPTSCQRQSTLLKNTRECYRNALLTWRGQQHAGRGYIGVSQNSSRKNSLCECTFLLEGTCTFFTFSVIFFVLQHWWIFWAVIHIFFLNRGSPKRLINNFWAS